MIVEPLNRMKADPNAFRTFEDLQICHAREFRKAMYVLSQKLPDLEKFGLASQIRRAAVSLTNNIAEGHGRHHYLEQIKFTLQARGSLEELIDDLNVCQDEGYESSEQVDHLKQHGWRVYQLINGYIRYLRERKTGSSLPLHEATSAYGLNDREPDSLLDDSTIQRFNDSTP